MAKQMAAHANDLSEICILLTEKALYVRLQRVSDVRLLDLLKLDFSTYFFKTKFYSKIVAFICSILWA